jgi:hypothetical protein
MEIPKSKESKRKVKSHINCPLFYNGKIASLLKWNIHLKRVNQKLKEKIRVLKNRLQQQRESTRLYTLIRVSFPSKPYPKKPRPQKS